MKDYKSLAKKIEVYFKNKNEYKDKINFSYKNLNRFDFNKNLNKYLKTLDSI